MTIAHCSIFYTTPHFQLRSSNAILILTTPTCLLRVTLPPCRTEVPGPSLAPWHSLPIPKLPQYHTETVAAPGSHHLVSLLSRVTWLAPFIPTPDPMCNDYSRLQALQTLPMATHHARVPTLGVLIQAARSKTMVQLGQTALGVPNLHRRIDLWMCDHSSIDSKTSNSVTQPLL